MNIPLFLRRRQIGQITESEARELARQEIVRMVKIGENRFKAVLWERQASLAAVSESAVQQDPAYPD
jgi:hypothetical protein